MGSEAALIDAATVGDGLMRLQSEEDEKMKWLKSPLLWGSLLI
jgi:hypothetical protein